MHIPRVLDRLVEAWVHWSGPGTPEPPALIATRQPKVPEGLRVYVIGDIHGRLDLLDRVLVKMANDLARSPVDQPQAVFLGDYIDRGPASAGVIDRLLDMRTLLQTTCLRGNHEAVLLDVLDHPHLLPQWKRMGGYDTLLSYGVVPPIRVDATAGEAVVDMLQRAMPEAHRAFLSSLQLSHVCGDYGFVHAGIRPRIAFDLQSERDLLWIRKAFLKHGKRHDKFIVHGHTPVPKPDIRSNRINLDTGAYATGRLTCLVLQGSTKRLL